MASTFFLMHKESFTNLTSAYLGNLIIDVKILYLHPQEFSIFFGEIPYNSQGRSK